MKKILILLISVMLILCACNKQPAENETTGQTVTTADGETETQENDENEGSKEGKSDSSDSDKEKNEEKNTSEVSESEILTMAELNSDNMQPEWTAETEAPDENTTKKPISEATTIRNAPEEKPSAAKKIDGSGYDLGDGIVLLDFTSYSGKYVEDGTDAEVENIAAITVENTGSKNIQYAEITVTVGGKDFLFNASTLLPGTKMTVLECNHAAYTEGDVTACGISVNAEFAEAPDTMTDRLTVQLLDGVVNVKNISDEDISTTVRIYIKNIEDGVYFGGITYRISLDSIASGEIKQLSASHVSADNSKVVFVTVAE